MTFNYIVYLLGMVKTFDSEHLSLIKISKCVVPVIHKINKSVHTEIHTLALASVYFGYKKHIIEWKIDKCWKVYCLPFLINIPIIYRKVGSEN